MYKTEQEILNEVMDELHPGDINGVSLDWDTCIKAMKRFNKQFEKKDEIIVDTSRSLIKSRNIFVFDVESTSLHGIGFAVGAVVFKRDGTIIDRFELLSKESELLANDWVKENVIPHLQNMPWCNTDSELRDAFYNFYMKHKETCDIWSDCNFPVETNFLSQIVNDNHEERQWNMPYPLKDISTIINVKINRAHTSGIKDLRKHHPLDDSIASANLLVKYFKNYPHVLY